MSYIKTEDFIAFLQAQQQQQQQKNDQKIDQDQRNDQDQDQENEQKFHFDIKNGNSYVVRSGNSKFEK